MVAKHFPRLLTPHDWAWCRLQCLKHVRRCGGLGALAMAGQHSNTHSHEPEILDGTRTSTCVNAVHRCAGLDTCLEFLAGGRKTSTQSHMSTPGACFMAACACDTVDGTLCWPGLCRMTGAPFSSVRAVVPSAHLWDSPFDPCYRLEAVSQADGASPTVCWHESRAGARSAGGRSCARGKQADLLAHKRAGQGQVKSSPGTGFL
jgi:hypothetical protein